MKNSIKQFVKSGAVLLALSLAFTSCDELIGELDNIAPSPVTPTPEPEPEPKPKPEPTLSKNYRVYTSGTAFTDEPIPAGATVVESSTADVTWSAGTYVVDGNKTITGDITLTGDVKLILRDGAELKVNGRIAGGDKSLNIYGQEAGTGKLTMDGSAGTGALNNILVQNLQIHGGDITGTNSNWAITTNGTFKIFHGTVSATAQKHGLIVYNGDLSIYGGSITASATTSSTIAYAVYVTNAAMEMTGGKLTATATGASNHGIFVDKDINISGGTVNATGGSSTSGNGGCGIESYGGDITISGTADVTAKGGNGGTTGGDGIVAANTSGKTITISGGTVNAIAGNGITHGIALSTNITGSIKITGGNVTTTNGSYGIYSNTIEIDGNSTIVNSKGSASGIKAATSITFKAGTVTCESTDNSSNAIDAEFGNIYYHGGTITGTGGTNGFIGYITNYSGATVTIGNKASSDAEWSDGTTIDNGDTKTTYIFATYMILPKPATTTP